jgi:hypothetical protein
LGCEKEQIQLIHEQEEERRQQGQHTSSDEISPLRSRKNIRQYGSLLPYVKQQVDLYKANAHSRFGYE